MDILYITRILYVKIENDRIFFLLLKKKKKPNEFLLFQSQYPATEFSSSNDSILAVESDEERERLRERESNKASIALLTLINSQLICTNFRFTRCKTRGSINPYFMTFYYEYLRSRGFYRGCPRSIYSPQRVTAPLISIKNYRPCYVLSLRPNHVFAIVTNRDISLPRCKFPFAKYRNLHGETNWLPLNSRWRTNIRATDELSRLCREKIS